VRSGCGHPVRNCQTPRHGRSTRFTCGSCASLFLLVGLFTLPTIASPPPLITVPACCTHAERMLSAYCVRTVRMMT
jgi:hypothetical protein